MEVAPERARVVLSGDCDQDSEQPLSEALVKALSGTPGLLEIDVADVQFADSSLLHVLLQALRAQQARRARFLLRGPLSVGVRQLLIQTGTFEVLGGCRTDAGAPDSR